MSGYVYPQFSHKKHWINNHRSAVLRKLEVDEQKERAANADPIVIQTEIQQRFKEVVDARGVVEDLSASLEGLGEFLRDQIGDLKADAIALTAELKYFRKVLEDALKE